MHNNTIEYERKPIIAQSTPQGSGALALVRASGENIFILAEKIIQLSSKKSILEMQSHTIAHGTIRNTCNEIIDDVMIIKMSGPKTFTGEDTLEITCHNNQLIVHNILQCFYECGFRPAEPGEFTRRAVSNEKIFLSQAEAIHELILANNQYAINNALAQLKGSVLSFVEEFDNDLTKIAAWCQANFEFLDEERDFTNVIISLIQNLIDKVKICINARTIQKQINDGIRVALVGDANAGKSSIFNMLLGQDRAIVTNIPGTTRDVIEDVLYYKNIKITLVDTAGIRNTENSIEQQGIKKSYEEINKADIILFIIDPVSKNIDSAITDLYLKYQWEKNCFMFFNKKDIYNETIKEYINNYVLFHTINNYDFISTKEFLSKEIILTFIHNKINAMLDNNTVKFIINERNFTLLTMLYNSLINLYNSIHNKKNIHYELLLISIHDMQQMLLGISGKQITEKSFDFVFKQFCVGK